MKTKGTFRSQQADPSPTLLCAKSRVNFDDGRKLPMVFCRAAKLLISMASAARTFARRDALLALDNPIHPKRTRRRMTTFGFGGRMKATGAICMLLPALATTLFLSGCKSGGRDEDDEDRTRTSPATRPPAQISFENGEVILTMDEPAQKRMGIEVGALRGSSERPQADVPATVLSAQDLASFRNGYVAARSQIEKSRVDIEVARKQYARAKSLFDSDQNISAKTLESADGSLRALETEERAAEQQLELQGTMAEQQWGGVVAKWAIDGSPELDRILGMREVLIQVTFPFDQNYAAPKTIVVEVPGRTRAEATLISAFPRVDPRVQGRSFLYSAPAQPDFTPGVNLVSHFAVGNSAHGVVVPASAVVWSEGKPWVYLQTGARQFSRREVPTDSPIDGGYFVTTGFSAEKKVVTKGAQSLLSEEALLQGYGSGASDEN